MGERLKIRLQTPETTNDQRPKFKDHPSSAAVNPSDTEAEDDAAEDELHGRNPNKVNCSLEFGI